MPVLSPCLAEEGVAIRRPELQTSGDVIRAQSTEDTARSVSPPLIPLPLARPDSESLRAATEIVPGWPVVIAGDTLFTVDKDLGPFTAEERAKAIADRIEAIIANPRYREHPIALREEISGTMIICDDVTITIVTHDDARSLGGLRQEIAATRAKLIQQIIDRERARRNPRAVVLGLLSVAIASIVLILAWQVVGGLSRRLKDRLTGRHVLSFGPLAPGSHSTADERRADRLIAGIKTVRILIQLALLYAYATFVTGFFAMTQGIHVSLNRQIGGLLDWAGASFVGILPKLFILATIVTITYIFVQMVRLLFVGISRGTVRWPGVRPEWALPSYRIVSIIITVSALVVAWPHIPGSSSHIFVGVAIFLAILIAIGSAATVANGFAGLIIGYTIPFRVGDHISISGRSGEVISWTLLVTRLRTEKNVEVIVPNSAFLTGSVINYSQPGKNRHLIVPANIALGYDVSPSRVHELVMEAARRTPNVLSEPEPFVLQKQLLADWVVYELNVYTSHPSLLHETASRLNENLREVFSGAGIAIHGNGEIEARLAEIVDADDSTPRRRGFRLSRPFTVAEPERETPRSSGEEKTQE